MKPVPTTMTRQTIHLLYLPTIGINPTKMMIMVGTGCSRIPDCQVFVAIASTFVGVSLYIVLVTMIAFFLFMAAETGVIFFDFDASRVVYVLFPLIVFQISDSVGFKNVFLSLTIKNGFFFPSCYHS